MTRSHPIVLLCAALTLVLSACGGGETEEPPEEVVDAQAQIEVSDNFGETPEIDIESPIELPESSSWTVVEGEGDVIGASATSILQLTFVNGSTGEPAISTYDEGQAPIEVTAAQIFPSLSEALVGQSAGTRLVVASTGEDAYGPDGSPQIGIAAGDPVIIVADVLSTDPSDVLEAPEGEELDVPGAAPVIEEGDAGPTSFEVSGRKPRELQVYTLIEGEGPEIENPSRVTANYMGEVWGADEPFDSSFERGEPSTFSVGLSVIEGWSQGLEGVAEGSRVMLVIPPALGYGAEGTGDIPAGSTLVFVIDVLGVG